MKRLILIFVLLCSPLMAQDVFFNASWSLTPTAATPTFSPIAGSYSGTQSVIITCSTSGSVCCYRTDGVDPTAPTPGSCGAGSTAYTVPVSVAATSTVKALATKTGYVNSAVVSAAYTITAPAGYADSFGGSALSGSWTCYTASGWGAPSVGSAQVYNKQGAVLKSFCSYTGSYGSDQTSQATVGALASTTNYAKQQGVCIHMDTSTGNGYCFQADGLEYISKMTAGVAASISGYCAGGYTNADVIKLVNVGSTITAYKNGVSMCTATDSTYTGGAAGFTLTQANQYVIQVSWASWSGQ